MMTLVFTYIRFSFYGVGDYFVVKQFGNLTLGLNHCTIVRILTWIIIVNDRRVWLRCECLWRACFSLLGWIKENNPEGGHVVWKSVSVYRAYCEEWIMFKKYWLHFEYCMGLLYTSFLNNQTFLRSHCTKQRQF